MMTIFSLYVKFVLIYISCFSYLLYAKNIGYKYVYDYESNLNLKNDTINQEIINFKGKVELTPYVLQDDNELLIVELKLTNPKRSIKGVTIRENGLTDTIYTAESATLSEKNLLSGLINILNVNKSKTNDKEPDVTGECSVNYKKVSAHSIRKTKSNCQPYHWETYKDNKDSFSVFNENNIYIDYVYDDRGVLVTVASYETHVFESILFSKFNYKFSSSTSLTYEKIMEVKGIKANTEIDEVIRNELGKKAAKIGLYSNINFGNSIFMKDDSKFIPLVTEAIKYSNKKSSVIKLVNLFRQIESQKTFDKLMTSSIYEKNSRVIHDAIVHCGTVHCVNNLLKILKNNEANNESEVLRILLITQNIRKPIPHLIKPLWQFVKLKKGNTYNQGIQTVSSIIQQSGEFTYLKETIQMIIDQIIERFKKCDNDICQLVHISAMKNSRLPVFYDNFRHILMNNGSYSNNVLAAVYNSICYLNYPKTQRDQIKKALYGLIKTKINFYTDTLIQYYAINSMVLLNVETSKIVKILDDLVITDIDFYYFLIKKLKALNELGVLESPELLMESKLFKKNPLLYHTYQDHKGSKVLIASLFDSNTSLVDIHFNILGNSKTGVIKHSLTDIFLVTTAMENHLFSLNSHMNGLNYFVNSDSNTDQTNENVEGMIQLSLFGKETSPAVLFNGVAELTSSLWSAPSELTSIVNGNFLQIDFQKNVRFQNGLIIQCNHVSNLQLDISFQLVTSLWYKTGDALVRATTKVYSEFGYLLNTIDLKIMPTDSSFLATGIDIRTELNFGSSPVKSCFSLAQSNSKYLFHTKNPIELPGYTFFLSKNINNQCSLFHNEDE